MAASFKGKRNLTAFAPYGIRFSQRVLNFKDISEHWHFPLRRSKGVNLAF